MIRMTVMTFMYARFIENGDLTHAELIKLCKDHGADGLEVFQREFIVHPENKALYRKLLADQGMTLPVMDVIVNLVHADAASRRQATDALRQGLDICAEMGTEIAHLAGCKPVEGVPMADARNQIADLLAEHVEYARERNLTLAFENFNPSPSLICSQADCLYILDRAGQEVKFVFDTGNFMAVGEDSAENLDAFYPRCAHFHFKDYKNVTLEDGKRKQQGVALGEGDVPNAQIASEIVRRGYAGWVALESLGSGSPREKIPADMRVLKRWLTPLDA